MNRESPVNRDCRRRLGCHRRSRLSRRQAGYRFRQKTGFRLCDLNQSTIRLPQRRQNRVQRDAGTGIANAVDEDHAPDSIPCHGLAAHPLPNHLSLDRSCSPRASARRGGVSRRTARERDLTVYGHRSQARLIEWVRRWTRQLVEMVIPLLPRAPVAVRNTEATRLRLAGGAVVAQQYDERVVFEPRRLEELEESADLLVPILEKSRIRRHEPAVDTLLLRCQRAPSRIAAFANSQPSSPLPPE